VAVVAVAWGGRAIGQAVAEARLFAGGPLSETAIIAALVGGQPIVLRPIGTTSIGFQVDLTGPVDAAFRPESRLHPRGWLAEVAAFRIARELGLDNVPPAVVRALDRGTLRRRLDPSADVAFEDFESQLVWSGPVVRGAFIYWVPGMQRSDLDTPAGIARWTRWLSQSEDAIPAEHRELARDLSNLVLFDYLIANRDRWSGGNVRPIESGRLIIRDHNLAFPMQLGESHHRRMLSFLRRSQRFSRSVIERLIALDESTLRAALADETPPSLLDDRQIEGVLDRRAAILSYVGALIEVYGEEAVLCFE
jgi:hypothetical protein